MRQNANPGSGGMAAEVTDAIRCITTIPTESLSIKAQGGWVFLCGELQSRHQKEFVEEVVRHLDGVKGVTNLIAIDPHPVSRN